MCAWAPSCGSDELPSSRKLVNADGITPVLAVPEARVPNGARAG